MSLLVGLQQADFKFLREKTQATAGNLSAQLKKLEEAGYLSIHKSFQNNYPHTLCKLTPQGRKAFSQHLEALKAYFQKPPFNPSS